VAPPIPSRCCAPPCRMPAAPAEHLEVAGQATPTAPWGMPTAGPVPGDIELAGNRRSGMTGHNSATTKEVVPVQLLPA
jgi:hypothetical protein